MIQNHPPSKPRKAHLSRRALLCGPAAAASLTIVMPSFAHDVSLRDRFLEAVGLGDVATVEQLLGTEPGLLHARDDENRSAYAVALLASRPAVAQLLLDRGYRPDVQEAALALDWPLFETLAGAAPGIVNVDHPLGTAMAAAARGGAGRSIWRVYRSGGDPNARPGGSGTPSAVRVALEHADPSIAEITAASWLGNGAAANPEEQDGRSPLHVAAERGFVDLVEILIRKGAATDARDRAGHTARDLAEARGHGRVVELLARQGEIPRDCSSSRRAYDVHGEPFREPDLSAFSVLKIESVVGAAHFDHQQTSAVLEQFPILAKAQGLSTEGAVEACAHTGKLPIVEDLLAHGAPYSLPTATMRDDRKRMAELLAEDPQRIHERGAHDFALLWYPVIGGGSIAAAELLLDAGAHVEQQHVLGTTALHWAARAGQLEMVAFLCEQGADVQRIARSFDAMGQTPLQVAEKGGHEAVAKLLRDRGAKG